MTKTVSNATPNVGDIITYTVTLSNHGPDAATSVDGHRPAPGGSTFVSDNHLGWNLRLRAPAIGPSDTVARPPPATLTIQATGRFPQRPDQHRHDRPTPTSSTPSRTTTATPRPRPPFRRIWRVKIALATGTTPLTVGQPANYTVTVINNGPDPADMVKVVIPLPASLTFISAAGPNWICSDPPTTVTCTTPSAPAGQTLPPISLVTEVGGDAFPSVAVEATVSSATFDPDLGNNTSTVAAPVAAQADLSITKTHKGEALAGSHLTYNLSVTNHGPTEAPGPITVTDPLPAGLSFVSATGPGWTCAAHGSDCGVHPLRRAGQRRQQPTSPWSWPSVPTAVPTVSNTATESDANANDPTPSNNSSTDSATVTPVANLKLTKTLQGSKLENGQQAAYQLAVTNRGPSEAGRAGHRHRPAPLRSDLCQCPGNRLDLLRVRSGGDLPAR